MLNDFFRINLPYGIERNNDGAWVAFNREYMPLGFNNTRLKGEVFENTSIHTKYKKVTDKLLTGLAWDSEHGIQRNEKGEITKIFLYNDGSNPRNQSKDKKELWDSYFDKLKQLSSLEVA